MKFNFFIYVLVWDKFGIVELFLWNIFVIEYMFVNVICVVYDLLGIKIFEKIILVRRDEFGGYYEFILNDKLYFIKRIEGR